MGAHEGGDGKHPEHRMPEFLMRFHAALKVYGMFKASDITEVIKPMKADMDKWLKALNNSSIIKNKKYIKLEKKFEMERWVHIRSSHTTENENIRLPSKLKSLLEEKIGTRPKSIPR